MKPICTLLLAIFLTGCPQHPSAQAERGEHEWEILANTNWKPSTSQDEGFGQTSRLAVPGGWIYREEATCANHGVSTAIVFVPVYEQGARVYGDGVIYISSGCMGEGR